MLTELVFYVEEGEKMDYTELAMAFMEKMYMLNKARPQKEMNESMRGESFVIRLLDFQGGSVQPSEISAIMGISSARIAAALNSLERKGLITRRIDPSDRRRILVDLTDAGKVTAEEQRLAMLAHTSRMFSILGEENAKEYVRLTGILADYAAQHMDHK